MTTEDDFHRILDKNPDDWQTRLAFAGWLQDRADPRAEGYRALGALRRVPVISDGGTAGYYGEEHVPVRTGAYTLPGDWLSASAPGTKGLIWYSIWWTRRQAEDAAALAFAGLPEARKKELLEGIVAGM